MSHCHYGCRHRRIGTGNSLPRHYQLDSHLHLVLNLQQRSTQPKKCQIAIMTYLVSESQQGLILLRADFFGVELILTGT